VDDDARTFGTELGRKALGRLTRAADWQSVRPTRYRAESSPAMKQLPHNWTEFRRDWPALSLYQRFEAFVAFVRTLVVSAVILVALYRLIVSVLETLVLRSLNPLEHEVFRESAGSSKQGS
jgi:hypothetical protein